MYDNVPQMLTLTMLILMESLLPMFEETYFDMHFIFSYLMSKARSIYCHVFCFISLHHTLTSDTLFSHHNSSSGKLCFHLLRICKNECTPEVYM